MLFLLFSNSKRVAISIMKGVKEEHKNLGGNPVEKQWSFPLGL